MGILRLTLTPAGPLTVPLARYEGLQGLFYRLLGGDPALAAEIHDKTPGEHRPYKFFCFTDLHGTYTALPGARRYDAPVTWEVRAADERIPAAVAAAHGSVVSLYGTPCTLAVTPVPLPPYGEERVFTMDTPLTVYRTDHTRHTVYYAPEDPRFTRGVEGNIRRKWRAFYGEEPPEGIAFTPVTVTPAQRRVIRYKQTVLTAYYGQYRLVAPPPVQAFLCLTGLGAKNAMGLGTMTL